MVRRCAIFFILNLFFTFKGIGDEMISGLVELTSYSLYNIILLVAGFVIMILGVTFFMDAYSDMKTKKRMMASLDTILGAGLNVIGISVMYYIWFII